MFSGDIYRVTIYWDRPQDQKIKHGSPTEFAAAVMDDGEVHILKIKSSAGRKVRAKKGRDRGKTFTIPENKWGIPHFFIDWAKEHNKDVDDYLRGLFSAAAMSYEMANYAMAKVRVTKGRLSAVFGVNIERTPYFFKDRDTTVTDSGRRKKIFHIVRTHPRVLKTGASVPVRTHFRGENEFSWNGYEIQISVPGWHHANFVEFSAGGVAIDEKDIEQANRAGLMGPAAVGRFVEKAERRGKGAHPKRRRQSKSHH
jgi:hypothetical protein